MKLKPKPVSAEVQRANQLNALQRKLGAIGYVRADSLTPYAGNPRKHPEKQIVKLMASISEFGIAMPILVDVNNIVIAGHAVLEAAKRLGMRDVPVLIADQWSSAQVRAYRLSANRLQACQVRRSIRWASFRTEPTRSLCALTLTITSPFIVVDKK
jgi:ParB-like nuclease domain